MTFLIGLHIFGRITAQIWQVAACASLGGYPTRHHDLQEIDLARERLKRLREMLT
jgi:hypothetical protein